MITRKIPSNNIRPEDLPQLFEEQAFTWNEIACCNWPQAFPYRPKAAFRISYNDQALLLHYRVEEASVKAEAADNGPIWTDSCVECFISPVGDGLYYNIEANCAGQLLIGCGRDRHNRTRADQEIRDKVQRWSSLGREPFGERPLHTAWELALVLPFECFFRHHIASLEDCWLKANFYKCGDGLTQAHYLSWQPIISEKPDFHRPEFFAEILCR